MMHILVPLDGSSASEEVLTHAARVFPSDTEYILLHALPVPALPSGLAEHATRKMEDEARHAMQQVHGRHGEKRLRLLVRSGDPAEEILKAALRENVDMIAMTTHARTGLARWMLGSVADAVVSTTGLAVFLVRPGVESRDSTPRRILVPVDIDSTSAEVVDTVRGLALRSDAEVEILHVVPQAADMAGRPQAAVPSANVETTRRRVEEMADRLEEAGLYAWARVTRGDPATEIIREAAKQRASLVAMTTRCREGLERVVVGSVAREVLARAGCPVLLQKAL